MDSSSYIVRETTTTTVFKYIKNQIITGEFRPGQWIREREIKELLGISSTPVREALKMLVQEGILVSIPHRGVRVKTFDVKEVQDFYEFRSEIEGLAVELAAKRRTEQQLQALETILEKAENELENQDDNENLAVNIVKYNNQFHQIISAASHNQSIINTLSNIGTEVDLLRVMSWENEKTRPLTTIQQHRLIFNAIVSKNQMKARSLMQKHILDSSKTVLKLAELRSRSVKNNT